MSQPISLCQRIIRKYAQETHLLTWIGAFLVDRNEHGLSFGNLKFFRVKLNLFTDYCDHQLITRITEITLNDICLYLLYLEGKGHNPGGIHAAYRTLRAFLHWREDEVEPEGWKNPIR